MFSGLNMVKKNDLTSTGKNKINLNPEHKTRRANSIILGGQKGAQDSCFLG